MRVSPANARWSLGLMKPSDEKNETRSGDLRGAYRSPPEQRRSSDQSRSPRGDFRRLLVLVLSITLLAGGVLGKWYEGENAIPFATAAMIRIGLVFGALWLAWPSLRRPTRWLPPGAAVMGVIALAVVAAQPRLILVAIPALGALISLAAIVRAVRGSSR